MITATTWVPRGFAAQFPNKIEFDEKEYARIVDLAKLQLEDAKEDLAEAEGEGEGEGEGSGGAVKAEVVGEKEKKEEEGDKMDVEEKDDDLREYDLDNYDEPTEEEKLTGQTMGMFGNIKSLAYYQNGEDDPYITMKEHEDEEEREELQILPTDNLILVAKTEDEIAHLEVYVYEDEEDHLYVHHDIMLPAIPLCVEWLDIPVGKAIEDKEARGNFVAVGTMDPDIEVWDLDVVDSMYPNAILGLGGQTNELGKKKKKKKKTKANDEYHVDAVLSLAGNRQHRNLLASASADKTVKLWDLNTTRCAKSYQHHEDKVCALAWNPRDATTLLSGSYDRTVVWADMRAPEAKVPRWGVESDVEDVKWDPHDPNYFYISTENGVIHFHDSRIIPSSPAQSKPVWTLQAHDKSVSAFDVNPIVPGFLVTGSMDKTVKLWNTQASNGGPSMVVSRDLGAGKVFSARFAPDKEVGFRLAVAGSKGVATVWDTSTNAGVRRAFADRMAPGAFEEGKEIKEKIVAVQDNSESEDDDDDDEEGDDDDDEDGEGEPDGWESMEEDV
ncbi:rRNA-processing protein [Rhizina undulata]